MIQVDGGAEQPRVPRTYELSCGHEKHFETTAPIAPNITTLCLVCGTWKGVVREKP